ncbi:MAG TPA: winged-helix domain-containing protein [Tepidisphaeraceae bacterium]|jgi:DNA-binding transcriptional ArsR family regulator|nr:winged-helix domain-containing protein [Tepidisphaeraceae bacterium]
MEKFLTPHVLPEPNPRWTRWVPRLAALNINHSAIERQIVDHASRVSKAMDEDLQGADETDPIRHVAQASAHRRLSLYWVTRADERARRYQQMLATQVNRNSTPQLGDPDGKIRTEVPWSLNKIERYSQHLHPHDVAILRALADAKTTLSQYQLVERVDVGSSKLSRKTISKRLRILRTAGLTDRPCGLRGGDAITERGMKMLRSLDA